LATPGVLCPVLVPIIQQRHRQTRKVSKEDHKDNQRAGKPAPRGKTEEVWSLLRAAEKSQGDLITVLQYLKGSYREDGGSLFTRSHMKTRGNEYKLLRRCFILI